MNREEMEQAGKHCLSSSTYLNSGPVKTLVPKGKGEGTGWEELGWKAVQTDAVKAEMECVIDQMSYASVMLFPYLKGQYVVLYRILYPEASEAQAQFYASSEAREAIRKNEIEAEGGKAQKRNTDGQYLEFFGITLPDDGWRVKYEGAVEYGDLTWCWQCEQWEAACGEEIGAKTTEYFTVELCEREGV